MPAKVVVFSGFIACFCFSFGCKQKKRFQKKSLMRECGFSLSSAIGFFTQSPLGFSASLLLNHRKGLNASLSLKPRRLFISFARTKETKQRKFAVCTFLPTPALFSTKQKELASLVEVICLLCFARCSLMFSLLRFYILSSGAKRRILWTYSVVLLPRMLFLVVISLIPLLSSRRLLGRKNLDNIHTYHTCLIPLTKCTRDFSDKSSTTRLRCTPFRSE